MIYRTWEKFGGGKFWRIITDEANGEENFGESAGRSSSYFTVFITIGVEKFGELYTIRQIRQNFPPPNFSHVRYNIMILLIIYVVP